MLWVDNATAAQMKPFADKLDTDVAKLVALVKTADYQTAQIANGAKSLMDEIGASKVTGEEDRYSHTDLYDFKANVDGARAVFTSLAADPAEARALTRRRRSRTDLPIWTMPWLHFRSGPGWVTYTKVDAVRPARPLARSRRARPSTLEHGRHRRAMSGSTEPEALARARGHRRRRSGRGAAAERCSFERRGNNDADGSRQDGAVLRRPSGRDR